MDDQSSISSPSSPNVESNESAESAEGRRDLFKALVICLLAVLVVRSFLFEPFKIPSSSMVPTLKIGDHIFVSKFNYGFSIPFTKVEFLSWGEPKRGEIVVFLFPRDETLHYIKRVVGVPGDTVEFRGKDLVINGNIVPKERVTDQATIERVTGNIEFTGELYKEVIDGQSHYVKYAANSANYEFSRSGNPEVIPPGKFFMVGDNRDDSYDSRSWGYVPRENIKGRAQMVWLSLDQEASWGALDKIRWSRCGTLIQ